MTNIKSWDVIREPYVKEFKSWADDMMLSHESAVIQEIYSLLYIRFPDSDVIKAWLNAYHPQLGDKPIYIIKTHKGGDRKVLDFIINKYFIT